MEREIEFRGQHKDTQKWYFGSLLDGEDNTFIRDRIRDKEHGYLTHPVIPETVGQFTGLKDKNGVKIFEGDILKKGSQIILVLWNEKYSSFTLHCNNWSCLSFFYEDINPEDCELIGNKIDNPELLR